MSVFNYYSEYYNLLYKDKDYQAESIYISNLIKKYKPNSKNIIELGCGTGKHANILSEEGFNIHGIDLSNTMLDQAKKLKNSNLSFEYGDVRNYRCDKKFDVAISLFHVASYQNTNEDLINYFKTARHHLQKDGIFIFDCWYGPAVLSQSPSYRVKELENDDIKVTRYAHPILHVTKNIVDVNYKIDITNKKTNYQHRVEEVHSMRYLFNPEIELFLNHCQFQLIHFEEFLTANTLSTDSWGSCFIVKAL